MLTKEDQEMEEKVVKTRKKQPMLGKRNQPMEGQQRWDQQMEDKGFQQREVNKDLQMLHNWDQPTEDKESPQIKEKTEYLVETKEDQETRKGKEHYQRLSNRVFKI